MLAATEAFDLDEVRLRSASKHMLYTLLLIRDDLLRIKPWTESATNIQLARIDWIESVAVRRCNSDERRAVS